ncbi:unnamed protein product [Prorocentrum cordatum]|uniref:DNA-directed DNA polymerase n=1 Tax=Prorocentrum cordatum TaxID=2364126 RepID=A0ABN9UTT6_9DINO|nr:unnamed protein product [Polarella glacialis]
MVNQHINEVKALEHYETDDDDMQEDGAAGEWQGPGMAAPQFVTAPPPPPAAMPAKGQQNHGKGADLNRIDGQISQLTNMIQGLLNTQQRQDTTVLSMGQAMLKLSAAQPIPAVGPPAQASEFAPPMPVAVEGAKLREQPTTPAPAVTPTPVAPTPGPTGTMPATGSSPAAAAKGMTATFANVGLTSVEVTPPAHGRCPSSPECHVEKPGAIVAFWVGFAAHGFLGPAVVPEPDWPRDGPGHELEDASTSSSVTSVTREPCPPFDPQIHCPAPPAPPAPTPASPEALRVVGEGVTATVEVPVVPASAIVIVLQAFVGWGADPRGVMSLVDGAVPGMRVLVQYSTDPGWTHERVLCWPTAPDLSEWMVYTAGNHLYPEGRADYTSVVKWTGKRVYPPGTTNVVAFSRPLTDEELLSVVKRGRGEAIADHGNAAATWAGTGVTWTGRRLAVPDVMAVDAPRVERRLRGKQVRPAEAEAAAPLADADGAAGATGPQPPPPEELPPGAWVLSSLDGGADFGLEVRLSPNAVVRGRYGVDQDPRGEWFPIEFVTDDAMERWREDKLVAADKLRPAREALEERLFPGREAGAGGTATPPPEPEGGGLGPECVATHEREDLRTCWIDADETGARFKEWRKVVQESTQEIFSDSSIRGPPACLEICRKMYRHGGTPKMWFQEWCKEQGVTRKDRAYHEVQTLIEVLYLAGTYDQLNMGALASLEVVSRRLLQYVEAYAHGAENANWGAAKHLGGTTNPLDLVPDALRSYASRLSKEEQELEALRMRSRVPGAAPADGAGAAAAAVASGGLPAAGAAGGAAAGAEGGDAAGKGRGRGGCPTVSRRTKGSSGLRGSACLPIAPLAALPDDWCDGLTPGQRRRWLRDGNAACKSLNYLHGGEHRSGTAPEGSVSQRKMDLIRADVQQRVFSAARRWIDVDSAITEQEALAKLLKGKAGYAPLGSTSMGSYEYSRVSLPDCVLDAPSLAQMLLAEARIFLEEYSTKICFPLVRIGLVTLTRRPLSVLGLFFVKKKDGERLRLIVDCRRSNALFRPPPGVDLLSGEGLGRIEVPVFKEGDLSELRVVLGVGDVADCFHRMKLDGDIRRYFCWPPLLASATGETLIEGQAAGDSEMVWPMSQSLPMGFSWSLFFAQAANQSRLDRQPSLAKSLRLSDRGPPLVLRRGPHSENLGHFMYVDSAGVLGLSDTAVRSALHEAQTDFDRDHLKFHEVELHVGGGRTLGCHLDGARLCTRPTDERFATVRKGLRCLLRQRKVAGWQLEMVLGHMTFMALVRRELLSIFHAVYAFVTSSYHTFSVLWPTVREELECFLGLMVMLEARWDRDWMPFVYSSDASLYGYGVAEAEFDSAQVALVGRISELSRWRLGAGLARQHAFESAGFLLNSETGEVVRDAEGAPRRLDSELLDILNSERWECDPAFPEVPHELLHDSHWKTVMADRWVFADDILRLEARALVKRTLQRESLPPRAPAAGSLQEPAASAPCRVRTLSPGAGASSSAAAPPARRARVLDTSQGLDARLVAAAPPRCPAQTDTVEAFLETPAGKLIPASAGVPAAAVDAGASQSYESSDVEERRVVTASRRNLELRGKARVRRAIQAHGGDIWRHGHNTGLSYLEKRSVGARSLETYRECALAFCAWAGFLLTAMPASAVLDVKLVEYMNKLFLEGVKSWRGEKLIAAMMFFHPDYGKSGGLYMPRALRTLKGWKRLSPSRSRKPLVFAIWAGIAVELARLGAPLAGVMVLIMVECYLRPGEMLGLTSNSFLPPCSHAVDNWVLLLFPESGTARSKTGSSDDSIPIDSGRMAWMHHIYRALRDRGSSQPLLGLTYPQFLALFRRAAHNIGVDAVPYQGRHSGASLDRASNRRTQEEVQKRGRWATLTSVKRYEKAGRLNESWEGLSELTKSFCVAALRVMEVLLEVARANSSWMAWRPMDLSFPCLSKDLAPEDTATLGNFDMYAVDGVAADEACCDCGGGVCDAACVDSNGTAGLLVACWLWLRVSAFNPLSANRADRSEKLEFHFRGFDVPMFIGTQLRAPADGQGADWLFNSQEPVGSLGVQVSEEFCKLDPEILRRRATLDALTEVTAELSLSNAAETRALAGAILTTVLTPVETAIVGSLLESGVGHNQQAQDWAKAKKEGPPSPALHVALVEQLVKIEESRVAATQTPLGESHAKLKKYCDEVLRQEDGMLKASLDVRHLLCKRAKKVEGKPEVAKITYLFQPTGIGVEPTQLTEAFHENPSATKQTGLILGTFVSGLLLGFQLGQYFAMRNNFGGRELWHLRVCCGCSPNYPVGVTVITPDLDEYEEDQMVGANFLDWVGVDGPIAVVPHAGVGAAYYRFRAPLTVAQVRPPRGATGLLALQVWLLSERASPLPLVGLRALPGRPLVGLAGSRLLEGDWRGVQPRSDPRPLLVQAGPLAEEPLLPPGRMALGVGALHLLVRLLFRRPPPQECLCRLLVAEERHREKVAGGSDGRLAIPEGPDEMFRLLAIAARPTDQLLKEISIYKYMIQLTAKVSVKALEHYETDDDDMQEDGAAGEWQGPGMAAPQFVTAPPPAAPRAGADLNRIDGQISQLTNMIQGLLNTQQRQDTTVLSMGQAMLKLSAAQPIPAVGPPAQASEFAPPMPVAVEGAKLREQPTTPAPAVTPTPVAPTPGPTGTMPATGSSPAAAAKGMTATFANVGLTSVEVTPPAHGRCPSSPECHVEKPGAIVAFWVGFAAHGFLGPAVVPEPDWPRDGPGHELEDASTSSSVTSVTREPCPPFDPQIHCPAPPAPPAPTPASPEALRVVGEGVTATVEVPVVPASAIVIVLQAFVGWGADPRGVMSLVDGAVPGMRVLVQYSTDPGWTHERVLCWPTAPDLSEWMVYTAGNHLYPEGRADYTSVVKWTGKRVYPPGTTNVVAFSRPLTDEELLSVVKRGRGEAIADHGNAAATWAGTGVTWTGRRLAVPDVMAVDAPRVERRLRGKQVRPAEAEAAAPLADADGAAGATGPQPPPPEELPPGAWVLSSLDGGADFGLEVRLSPNAVVRGRYGVDQDPRGEWFPIEFVTDDAMERWREDKLVAADKLRPAREALEERLFPGREAGAGGTATPPPEPEGGGLGPECVATHEREDLRTCWIDADETGARFKEWRKVVQESTQEIFSDSSIRGPPACLEICRKMYRHGGTPKMWFQEWCKEQGVTRKDRAYHEVQTLIEVLYLAGTYDQLNMGALASLEVVSRRLLQYVEAYAHGAENANWGAAKHLGGTTNPLDLVPDALRSYASRLSKEEQELEALRMRSRVPGAAPADGAGAAAAAVASGGLPAAGAAGGAAAGAEGGDAAGKGRGRGGCPTVSRRTKGSSGLRGSACLPIAPLAALPDDWCDGLTPGQRRRWLRDGNAACKSLNYLHGGEHRSGTAPEGSVSQRKMDLIRADVQQRVFSAARRWIDVDSAITEQEALAKLLKGKAGYAPLGSTSMGSYEYSRVSLPDCVLDAPSLAQMLLAEARIFLEEYSTKICFPLVRIGLVTLTRRPLSVLGLFFVKKKDGERLRLIVDCRRSNALFRPPPGVDLLSGEGLGRIEVPVFKEGDLSELRVVLGVGDVADCFHRMKLDGDIRRYFCWPPLLASATGETLIEGQAAGDSEMVWPMSQSLPMGFSWSLFFAQAANQSRLDRQPSLAKSLRLSDRGPPLVLRRGPHSENLGHFMYVDSAGVLGLSDTAVRSALHEAQTDFDRDHLKFHEVELHVGGGRTLGCHLDGARLCTRPTDERFATVRKGLRCLLRQRKVAGWQLEMVLGHMTFMALVRRELLSIFHAVYAFVTSSYHTFSVLWPTVREELECFLGLMVMLEARWDRDWMPFVYSSDASLYGYGVAEAEFDSAQVALVGRISELSRWRLCAGLARQHAFESAGFLLNSETGEVVRDAEGAPRRLDSELLDILNSERWECDPAFPEVPHELLHDSHWKTVMADRWVFADDILRLEARALVKRTLQRESLPPRAPAAGSLQEPAASAPCRVRTLSPGAGASSSAAAPPARRARVLDTSQGLDARLVAAAPPRCPAQTDTVEAFLETPAGKLIPASAGVPAAAVDAGASQSYESSDVEERRVVTASRRNLELRGKARVRRAIQAHGGDIWRHGHNTGLSYLEKRSVGARSLETYRECALAFCAWAGFLLTAMPASAVLDVKLVEYMNKLFLEGVKSWRGEKLIAAMMFFHPDYGKSGGLYMPRALRTLKGWKRLSPSRSRKPLVFAIWAGIAVELARLGAPLAGVMVLIMVECYLRPGEMLGLTSNSFLPPCSHAVDNWVLLLFPESGTARSKTGSSDDSIPIDSGRMAWMHHIYRALRDRGSSQPLLGLTYPQFLALFRRAAHNIGVDAVPYQGRHSGASLDRASNRRTQEEVQKRGRWATLTSVKRYEKAGRLNESWEGLSELTKSFCVAALRVMEVLLEVARANSSWMAWRPMDLSFPCLSKDLAPEDTATLGNFDMYAVDGVAADEACCDCGGGVCDAACVDSNGTAGLLVACWLWLRVSAFNPLSANRADRSEKLEFHFRGFDVPMFIGTQLRAPADGQGADWLFNSQEPVGSLGVQVSEEFCKLDPEILRRRATLDALTEVTAELSLSNAAETRALAGAILTTVLTPVETAIVGSLLESGVGHNQQAQDWAKAKKEGPPSPALHVALVEQLVKIEESRVAATQTPLGESHAKLKKYCDEVLRQEDGMLKASLDVRHLLCKRAKKVEGKPEVAKITYLFQPTGIGVEPTQLTEAFHENPSATKQTGLILGTFVSGLLLGFQLGQYFAMRNNFGGRELWHLRVCCGCSPNYPVGVTVITPDLDEYEEDQMVGANFLDWVGVDGPIAVVPHAGVGAAYYRFRAPLTVAQVRPPRGATGLLALQVWLLSERASPLPLVGLRALPGRPLVGLAGSRLLEGDWRGVQPRSDPRPLLVQAGPLAEEPLLPPGRMALGVGALHLLVRLLFRRPPPQECLCRLLVYDARSSVLQRALKLEGRDSSRIVEDCLPAVSLSSRSDTACAVYVDNFMVMGSDRKAAESSLDGVCRRLLSLGLTARELSAASRDISLAWLNFSEGSKISIKPSNMWHLRFGVESLLRRGVCSGSALQIVMGHVTWASLLRREVPSAFCASCQFTQSAGSQPQKLWPRARQELWTL